MNNNNCNWIVQKYDGVLEIYPTKCLNTEVLNAKLKELSNDYTIVQVFSDWIRAFKN